jgi:hypothetical protein
MQGAHLLWSGIGHSDKPTSPWLTIETDFQRKKGGPTYYLQATWL